MARLACIALVAAILFARPDGGCARPFTVEDLLQEEAFGAVVVDPAGRRVVFERHAPYASLDRYDHGIAVGHALSRLLVADLRGAGQARPLLSADVGPGVEIAGFSPAGRTLAVTQLAGTRWRLGTVEMATGGVRWWDVAPELPGTGQALQWRTETELLVLDRPEGDAPWPLSRWRASAERLPGRWAAAARGEVSVTALGSGAYLGLRPRPSPVRLLSLDLRRGTVRELARGRFTDLALSPDGRHVALLARGADLQPAAHGPAQGAVGLQTEAANLVLIDLADGRIRAPLGDADLLPTLLSWSPDGRRLLVFARRAGAPWRTGTLQVVDARTGAAGPVGGGLAADLSLRPETVAAGWLGPRPVVFARPRTHGPSGGARADWYALDATRAVNLTAQVAGPTRTLAALDARGLVVQAGGALWRVDAAGRARRLAGPARLLRPATNAPPGRLAASLPAWSWASVDGAVVRVTGEGLRPLGMRAPWGDWLGASDAAGASLVRLADPAGPARLAAVGPRGVRTLAVVNAALADAPAPRLAPVRHRGPDGVALVSWLFLPPAPPAEPPPLVIVPYLGAAQVAPPIDGPAEQSLMVSVRALVGHGYAVLVPSLPLPAGMEPMADVGPRLVAIADAAAGDPALAGTFDRRRMALWGFSFGAYTVTAAIGQTDAFRAAVAIAGPSDLIARWGALAPTSRAGPERGSMLDWSLGTIESGQSAMGGPPWADSARYLRNSPLMAADRITTPLLLAHGDQDVVPLSQSEAMFAALYRQSKDAVLLTYWGESHLFASPGNVRDFYRRAFAFLDEHLAPVGGAVSAEATPSAHPGPAPASGGPRPPWPPPRGCPGRGHAR